jgi:LAS superfamily LD-carboxypeptidase LdcB
MKQMGMRFMASNFDLLTGRNNPYLLKFEDALVHKDMIPSFKLLEEKAKDEIGASLKIISSFRDYERQEKIWNLKAQGKRTVLNDKEIEMKLIESTPEDFIEYIMRFSAIPGLSRHHWGTDIDIFDASKLGKENVQLVDSECRENGPFCELHEWLDKQIQNGEAYNFFRPYSKDLGGIAVEKWHLSYAPLSQEFFNDYTIDTFQENIDQSEIDFKEIILKNLDLYFEKYFKRITLP